MSMRSSGAAALTAPPAAARPPRLRSPATDDVSVSRTRVMENGIALVESLRVAGPRDPRPGSESYSPDFQVCLPYHGAFVWHVGRDAVVADPNRVLFVSGGEGFRLSRPIHGGYAELIVTVRPDLLAEMLAVPERHLAGHALFRQRSRPAELRLQHLGSAWLHRHARDGVNELAGEERLVEFLRASVLAPSPAPDISPSTARLIGRAKTYLSANLAAPVRLTQVARAVGTSPAYLTTVFRRVEGRPLHQYLVQLRLARALVELPQTTDITELACALGFANHSHFTAMFRRAFGCTPSSFRESRRGDRAAVRQRASESRSVRPF